jgi:preprotein translocase SecE subunit
VSPSWIEVRTTTFVVIITVVLFGVFFFLVDWIFRVGVNNLLNKLGGSQ